MERVKRQVMRRPRSSEKTAAGAARSSGSTTASRVLALQKRLGNRATTALIQRQINIEAPQYTTRDKSLAASMLEGLQNTEMGLTIPRLNGTPFFGEGIKTNEMGKATRPEINLPKVTVEDSKKGIEFQNQYPTTREKVYNMFGSEDEFEWEDQTDVRDDEARIEYNKDRWLGWADVQPLNVFGWTVEVPSAGPWIVDDVPKARLVGLVKDIARISSIEAPDAEEILKSTTGRLVVTDPDGDEKLVAHTRQHENQHVGDHRGLVWEMFGPWDAFSGSHVDRQHAIRSDERLSITARFMTAAGYTPGAARIVDEFANQMQRSGDHYHDTKEGSVPLITVASVSDDTVTVHVKPVIRLADGDIPKAQYRWSGTRIQG